MATGKLSQTQNQQPMINLNHDSLSFTFPEVAGQLRLLVEQHIRNILPELLLPAARVELLCELESTWEFQSLNPKKQDDLRAKARSLTNKRAPQARPSADFACPFRHLAGTSYCRGGRGETAGRASAEAAEENSGGRLWASASPRS